MAKLQFLRKFLVVFIAFAFALALSSCDKKDPDVAPAPSDGENVSLIVKLGGPKGKPYMVRFFIYDQADSSYLNPIYSSPEVQDSLNRDYTYSDPAIINVPYPGLNLKGNYNMFTEVYTGPTFDRLEFRAGSRGGTRLPFRETEGPGSKVYYFLFVDITL